MPSYFPLCTLCTFLTSESISACSDFSKHGGSFVPTDRTKMVVMRLDAHPLAYFTVSFCFPCICFILAATLCTQGSLNDII